jgi:hypothetical protein
MISAGITPICASKSRRRGEADAKISGVDAVNQGSCVAIWAPTIT